VRWFVSALLPIIQAALMEAMHARQCLNLHDLQIFQANDALVHVARSSNFTLRLLSNSILWLHLLLLNLKLLLLLRLHLFWLHLKLLLMLRLRLLFLHQRLLLLLPTTQRSFAISSDEFHLPLSQGAGRRWSLRWLVKHRRLQLLWCCHVIATSLRFQWHLQQKRSTLLFHWILLRRLQRLLLLLLLRSPLRCLLRWHLIMRRLLPVCKLRQRLLLLLHPRRLRGLLLLLRRLLRRQLRRQLLRRTLNMLLQWRDIAYILLETVHSFCLLPLLLQTLLLQHKLQCLALLLLRLLQLSLRC
jgi:hypothetical protein